MLLNTVACFEKNVEYVAGTNEIMNPGEASNSDARETSKDCQELCKARKECTVFVWNSQTKSCKLLKGATSRGINDGIISGPPICRGKTLFSYIDIISLIGISMDIFMFCSKYNFQLNLTHTR